MPLPFVIDNENTKLGDALNELLAERATTSLDIASAYFAVSGYRLVREGLQGLTSFRLLLGAAPEAAEDVGLRPHAQRVADVLRGELETATLSPAMMELVEDLIRFLRRDDVQVRVFANGFLHAKCYLFYHDPPTEAPMRLFPVAGIVGSGNFTGPGLATNKELNLAHFAHLSHVHEVEPELREARQGQLAFADLRSEVRTEIKNEVGLAAITELDRWFRNHWEVSADFKNRLIGILDDSKFGGREYTPWEVYLKALFEYFRDDLEDPDLEQYGKSAIELAEFQEDAVKKARKILARYDGVLVADSVGLGKTWIGKKLLEDYAYHQRLKALVVCPASLRQMWEDELAEVSIAARFVNQERLGQAEFDARTFADVDLILLDESHNFRKLSQLLQRETEEDDAAPRSLADEIDENEEARALLETMEPADPDEYDLKRLNDAIQHDVDVLTDLWRQVQGIGPKQDAKLARFKRLLREELKGQKVLVFSYFKDTAKYVHRQVVEDKALMKSLGGPQVRLMDSDVDTEDRKRVVQAFAPKHNDRPDWAGTEKEVDLLISTDVLSEGQNLQDCG